MNVHVLPYSRRHDKLSSRPRRVAHRWYTANCTALSLVRSGRTQGAQSKRGTREEMGEIGTHGLEHPCKRYSPGYQLLPANASTSAISELVSVLASVTGVGPSAGCRSYRDGFRYFCSSGLFSMSYGISLARIRLPSVAMSTVPTLPLPGEEPLHCRSNGLRSSYSRYSGAAMPTLSSSSVSTDRMTSSQVSRASMCNQRV